MSTPRRAEPPFPLTRPMPGAEQGADLSVTSLTLGLVSLLGHSRIPVINVLALLVAPLAVLLGLRGRHDIEAEHQVLSWFGIVTGSLAVVVSIALLAVFINAAGTGALS